MYTSAWHRPCDYTKRCGYIWSQAHATAKICWMLADGGRGWEAEEEQEQARGNIYQIAKEKFNFLLQGLIVFRQLLKDICQPFFLTNCMLP